MDPKTLAAAAKHFEKFYESEVFADILDNFASVCELLKVQPGNFVNFYPDLKVRELLYKLIKLLQCCNLHVLYNYSSCIDNYK